MLLTISIKNFNETKINFNALIAKEETFKSTCRDNIPIINDESFKEACEKAWQRDKISFSFYTTFFNAFVIPFHSMNMYMFVFLIIPVAFLICTKLKNNYLKNYLTRESYKKFKNNLFKEAYSSVLIFPIIIIIIFILCLLYTQDFTAGGANIAWSDRTTSSPILFCLLYLINVFLYSVTYINFFLISARKNHNFVVSIIVSFLLFIGVELFFEIFINSFIFIRIFHSGFGLMFNIMNSLTFNEQFGVEITIFFGLLWCVLSSLLVHCLYKNPEKILMDCEKNNNKEKNI